MPSGLVHTAAELAEEHGVLLVMLHLEPVTRSS